MRYLPVETWRHIVKSNSNYADWLSLSTTSSFFRQIAQEALYESVILFRRLDGDADCEDNERLALFVRSLAERPALALCTRSLTVWNDFIPEGEEIIELERPADHPLLCNLALFSHLRQLTIGDFMIDQEFYSTLCSHSRLEQVTFISCSAESTLPVPKSILDPSKYSVSTMNITQPYGQPNEAAWATIVPAGIRTLELFSPPDAEFVEAVLSSLKTRVGTNGLTTLCIRSTRSLPRSILTTLTSSPQLQRLSLLIATPELDQSHPLHSLPPDAIPLLQEFTGPANLYAIFIRGRPVHTVKMILGNKSAANNLQSLKLSAVPVTTVEFMGSASGLPYLLYAPVSVVCFGWSSFIVASAAQTMLSRAVLSHLTNLRIIRGRVLWPVENTAQEHRMELGEFVRTYSAECPSIEEFDFGRERWLSRTDGGLECYFSS